MKFLSSYYEEKGDGSILFLRKIEPSPFLFIYEST